MQFSFESMVAKAEEITKQTKETKIPKYSFLSPIFVCFVISFPLVTHELG